MTDRTLNVLRDKRSNWHNVRVFIQKLDAARRQVAVDRTLILLRTLVDGRVRLGRTLFECFPLYSAPRMPLLKAGREFGGLLLSEVLTFGGLWASPEKRTGRQHKITTAGSLSP